MKNNFAQNKYPIYTNNFDIHINRENVAEQYTIFQIGTKESFFKTNVLDIAVDKFKAQSVAYYNSNRWFAMFNKASISFNEFRTSVQEIDDTSIVNEVDLFDTDKDSHKNIQDVELAQLLVNSLKNRKRDKFSYNNITGSLFYTFDRNENSKSIKMLKLRFYKPSQASMIIALQAEIKTFSEYNALKKYHRNTKKNYTFDTKTGEFRHALKSDTDKDLKFYDEGVLSRNKDRTKFLDFSSNTNFSNSKVGKIASFLKDTKEKIGNFIQISQIPIYEYNSYEEPLNDYENKDYAVFLQNRGICVVDTIKDADSKAKRKLICDFLKKNYNVQKISKVREQGKYVIEIIHEKDSDYYTPKADELNIKLDQHNFFSSDDIIQHITVENFEIKYKKDILQKSIQELIIKGDIYDRQISITNWRESKEWNFVCCGTGQGTKPYSFTYYKLNITKTGKLSIETFDTKKFSEATEEWKCIDYVFSHYNEGNKNKNTCVESIIYNNIDEINVICGTGQFTLPNIENISKELDLSDNKKTIEKNELKDYINEFAKSRNFSEEEKEPLKKILENIESCCSNRISYSDIFRNYEDKNKSLYRKKIVQEFNEWVKLSKGILLHEQLRGKNAYKNFNSFLWIKSTELNGIFKYFVGKKKNSVQLSLATTCRIYDVIPWNKEGINLDGKILFDEFAHMLTVEFVRNGQYTVLPFPVKYLREYIRFCEKDIDFD